MAVVGCGPGGEGYEIQKPAAWVKKHAKLISCSMLVVRVALAAGRAVGVPLPGLSLSAIVPSDAVKEQVSALAELVDKLPGCELPSASDCEEALCADARAEQKAWTLPAKLQGANYKSFKDWLEKAHPDWKKSSKMKQVFHGGRVEWVSENLSKNNVENWKESVGEGECTEEEEEEKEKEEEE
jgi:hypothetical protein